MLVKMIKIFTNFTPLALLPTGNKLVNGETMALNPNERRDFLNRKIMHRAEKNLNSYSPIRRIIKFRQHRKVEITKSNFYKVIGKITLAHAAIEQHLKNTLMVDWGIPQEFTPKKRTINLEYTCGKQLIKFFLEKLEELYLPEGFLDRYGKLCFNFEELSEKRNETLKAVYSFNQHTSEISKIREKHHANFDNSMSFEEHVNLWMPKVEVSNLNQLFNDLESLRGNFLNLRCEIKREKIKLSCDLCCEIGKSYPESLFKNPYMYKLQLEQDSKLSK